MQLRPLVALLAAAFAAPAALAAGNVVISQVYGAGGNGGALLTHDYVELHNRSASTVNLAGWTVQYASATGTGALGASGNLVALSGTLEPGQFYLVRMAGGSVGAAMPAHDASGSIAMAAGAGKVALVKQTTSLGCNGGSSVCSPEQLALIEDLVGFGSTANFFEGTGPTPTISTTLAAFRAANGCTDTDNNAADFATGTPAPRNKASAFAVCSGGGTPPNAPIVTSCGDQVAVSGTASGFTVSAKDADSRITTATVVGSLPAGVALDSFVASTGDDVAATQSFTVSSTLAAGNYNLGLKWDNDEAQTASCSFKLAVSGIVSIPAIQGSGAKSTMDGASVTTSGVVTQLINNGFYLQDPIGDGDAATSDGIFVFTSTAPTVAVGDRVTVSAKVQEYSVSSSAASLANPLTELSSVSAITVLSSGNALPPAVDVSLAAHTAQADMERYEGMLVRITDALTVNQTNFVGSYGQLTVSAGGRTLNPTNVMRPGAAANALQAANLARSIVLDDGSSLKFPNPTPYLWQDGTVRGGDTVSDVVGVVDFGPSTDSASGPLSYKIHPAAAPVFARTAGRPAAPPAVGGNIKVASANVLNFFTSGSGGAFVAGSPSCGSDCRGANSLAEFNRQRTKILAALSGLNADVVGLMEIQNNASNFAVQNLVDGLNAQLGAGTYAAVPLPTVISAGGSGTGTDAIRVAMIYKPGKLALMGPSMADTNGINNRPTFAQGFVAPNGEKFAVAVNHLKSKGSCGSGANGDTGDLQGCWNLQRQQQAQRLLDWLPTIKATATTEDVILIGDFNAYAKEDPIELLTTGGLVDLVSKFDPADYSYVFDANAGRLDHGLGTASVAAKVTGATSWHINADEPEWADYNTEDKATGNDWYQPTLFRASDHDPMLIGLNLVKAVSGTSGRDTIVGTAGDDIIEGGAGADTLTGGAGSNQFVYGSMLDAGDVITDFKPGVDTLVLTRLLAVAGISSAAPLATGHVSCTANAAGAIINIDTDGSAGATKPKAFLQLKGVSCTAINASSFKF
ncbi:ExeM/NucH family extracellular endonuclease [Roseateles asaccharophilus]|uniref:Extracellular nuclease n=1 Tax=Roseateles asaccharophilus TaxID=582607 RepID=A0ABU2A195_9BURK|nr:ExeM/NucH family extracellular endonuclease [Roseateles asaccharophilus]MDR7330962.1 putative extracellular nuclease [Roseateles asaccharophilus]